VHGSPVRASDMFVLVGRVRDGLPLVATHDAPEELYELTRQAKEVVSASLTGPERCSLEAGDYVFHYLVVKELGVCYLALVGKSYPRQLVFQFLDQLHRAFAEAHGPKVAQFSRPYQAIAFDPVLNRIRKEYLDPRSPANLKKLNEDLLDIHQVMRKNISDVLMRGEKLSGLSSKSALLAAESKKFKKQADWLELVTRLKGYAPAAALVLLVGLVLWWKLF